MYCCKIYTNWVCNDNKALGKYEDAKIPPSPTNIIHWHNLFMGNGNLGSKKGNGRPRTSAVNEKNERIWGTEHPTESNQSFLNSASVMEWCAVTKEKVMRPCFFEDESVNGENYRNMIVHFAFTRFAPLKGDYAFHQDRAPPHYSTRVRTYLKNKRPNNWIGRGGPVEWTPRSPDLTSCDFLWGYVKGMVYNTLVTTIEDLKTRIRRACRGIRPDVLRKVWDNTKLCLTF